MDVHAVHMPADSPVLQVVEDGVDCPLKGQPLPLGNSPQGREFI